MGRIVSLFWSPRRDELTTPDTEADPGNYQGTDSAPAPRKTGPTIYNLRADEDKEDLLWEVLKQGVEGGGLDANATGDILQFSIRVYNDSSQDLLQSPCLTWGVTMGALHSRTCPIPWIRSWRCVPVPRGLRVRFLETPWLLRSSCLQGDLTRRRVIVIFS